MDKQEAEVVEQTDDTEQAATATQERADAPATEAGGEKQERAPTALDGASDAETGEGKADAAEFSWPDDWRERMAEGDDDALKLLKRYGSVKGVARALVEKDRMIRSGKVKRDAPDPSDEKAMAEWRKENGIPDDPTGYELPESVTKRLTDDDKPILASFTEYAHKRNAPPEAVNLATEWYIDALESMEAERVEADRTAAEAAEDALRKEWAHGEYKANLTLAIRFLQSIPEVGASWSEARLPDGRRLGDIPAFIQWASDQGRGEFGDATFASSDAERRHTARKDELERLMREDIDKYYESGADKEYVEILERETRRKR